MVTRIHLWGVGPFMQERLTLLYGEEMFFFPQRRSFYPGSLPSPPEELMQIFHLFLYFDDSIIFAASLKEAWYSRIKQSDKQTFYVFGRTWVPHFAMFSFPPVFSLIVDLSFRLQ